MTRTDSLRGLMAVAAIALALCLLALVEIKPAETAFPGKQSFMLLLPPFAATPLGWMWLGYAAILWVLLGHIVVRGGRRQKIANPWQQPARSYRRKET